MKSPIENLIDFPFTTLHRQAWLEFDQNLTLVSQTLINFTVTTVHNRLINKNGLTTVYLIAQLIS